MINSFSNFHSFSPALATPLNTYVPGLNSSLFKLMKHILLSKIEMHYKKRRLSSSEKFYEPEQLMRSLYAFKEVE
jgi:hypothetical protein